MPPFDPRVTPVRADLAAKYLEGKVAAPRYAEGRVMEVVEKLNSCDGIAAYELNISCPNTKHGGMVFGQSRQEDLITYLLAQIPEEKRDEIVAELQIDLSPANRNQINHDSSAQRNRR